MSATINFGIDLGTTNSLIATIRDGKVEVFKNPISLKETLPSVVAFRKERIIIGDKAKEYVEKDPENVFSCFKRKMGTSEEMFVKSTGQHKSPVYFSTLVLQELKSFIYTGEIPDSVVITIPASFDTIQSNATKKAGYEAGFKEVVLLQEPIAASLAFANKNDGHELKGQWLAYDLGGGTFDVALIRIDEDEMKVIDHEGDNFLGGMDFDFLVLEKIVVPHLEKTGSFQNLLHEFRSATGKYNKLYYILLHKIEEVKIMLSSAAQADIEFEITDDNDEEHEVFLTISRAEFEACIQEKIDYSIDLVRRILERNSLSPADLNQVIMIGGSTYIPAVRNTITAQLGLSVNCSVDPTTAVGIGAAYYAGTKTKNIKPDQTGLRATEEDSRGIRVKMAYQKTSRETEEYFTAAVSGELEGLFYRITREDGGYDSGVKVLKDRISESLSLLPNMHNIFSMKVYDSQKNPLPVFIEPIQISQGKFSIYGQPLPNDICIEVDDFENNTTKLELLFEKNAILPLRKTFIKEITRTMSQKSDDALIVNILEGNRYALPSSNVSIGAIEIKGSDMQTDLIKGSDIEITVQISESRDLTITAVLLLNDQEFTDVFSPSNRSVNLGKLKEEVKELLRNARQELQKAESDENYESAAQLQQIRTDLEAIYNRLSEFSTDDVTDEKYQLEEKKRKLAARLDNAGKDHRLAAMKEEYFVEKTDCEYWINKANDEARRVRFEQITANEKSFLSTNSAPLIKKKIQDLTKLAWEIRQHDPHTIIAAFHWYANRPSDEFTDRTKAKQFIEMGEKALERQNYNELYVALASLSNLIPDKQKAQDRIRGTGIG
ncbi:MAG: Hsp70 family protein [Cytophagales bacterium]|nr:Hsp70 family protein [Cytophagales bacterium]